jgi:hypothetical protein
MVDRLFVISLLKATEYKLGQVAFDLYDENKSIVAKGTPYL